MPTKPLESILWREFSKKEMKEVISIASPLLIEVVNYGTNLLARCHDSSKAEPDVDIALISLYHHMLEMTDGIQVLVSQGSWIAAIPALRSSFEAFISMGFILEPSGDYVQRGLCWCWGYLHNEIEKHSGYLPTTIQGQNFHDKLKGEFRVELEPLADKEAQERIDLAQKILAETKYHPIEAEYQRLKGGKTRKSIEWYSLFSGIQNLRELSIHLKLESLYILLYKEWSEISHAKNFHSMTKDSKGNLVFERIRNPSQSNLAQLSLTAIRFMIDANSLLLSKFRPEENINEWYIKEIQQGFRQLKGLQYNGPVLAKKVSK